MEQNSLGRKDFEPVKELGSGSFGKVELVRKKSDQQLYALKSVNLVRLNQKEKDSALNEVRLLASITIPYVIGYRGSFFDADNNSLCIVMEFADGGDL
jgi:NIMA (never in mitosis gene a)-related kinase